jgi:hypothetical protein
MEYRKRNRLYSSRALLQESLHNRFILRQIICAGIVRLPAGAMLSKPRINTCLGKRSQWLGVPVVYRTCCTHLCISQR